jgi:hypothetical protein
MILIENFICDLLAHATPAVQIILDLGFFKIAPCNPGAKEDKVLQLFNCLGFFRTIKPGSERNQSVFCHEADDVLSISQNRQKY